MAKSKGHLIHDYLLIVAGTTLLAFAITYFYDPNQLVIGGVSGLAIIIADRAQTMGVTIPLWLTNIVLNVPLFLLAYKYLGRQFLTRTLFSTVYLSLALWLTSFIPLPKDQDLILSSLFGGVISGAGTALVFRSMATTGGSDMLVYILHRVFKRHSLSQLLFVIDGAVIALGLLTFGHIKTMYAIIAVFVTAKIVESILEGVNFAKAAFIISDEARAIAQTLMAELNRGVTSLNGQGMFTGNAKNVLLCVVSSKEMPKLKKLVKQHDQSAFVIVADVRETLGEGFKEEL
ncbi:MAG: YitT family protein [Clostridiales bacterium]|nr:YitT family protein [Clostridiales bacterium]